MLLTGSLARRLQQWHVTHNDSQAAEPVAESQSTVLLLLQMRRPSENLKSCEAAAR